MTRAGSTLAAACLALVACGDGAGPADPIAECLEAAGIDGPAVAIRDFAFTPDTLRVTAGETVTWVNCERPGVDAHTATADGGAWDSGFLSAGETFAHRFDEPGEFPYHCVPHPFMRGTVIVQTF